MWSAAFRSGWSATSRTVRMSWITAVPDDVQPALLAVLREALSNTARHAKAGRVEVGLAVRAGHLTLTVTDDGVGIGTITSTGGLRNLAERAHDLGGEFTTEPAEPRGTILRWSIPLSG